MKNTSLILFFLVSLLMIGCQDKREALPTISVGHALHDHHAALFIAAQLPDYFYQQGGVYLKEIEFKKHYLLMEYEKPLAEVMLHSSPGGGQLIRKLHEKQVDLALGGVPAIIKQIDSGSQMKIIAPLMSEGAALVIDKNIPAEDWASFIQVIKQSKEVVRIGYKIRMSVQNLIFEQALKEEGIAVSREQIGTDTEVVVRNLYGPKNLIPALKNGLIDGFVVMQPYASLAEYQGHGKVIAQLRDLPPDKKWEGHPCCAIAGNPEILKSEREVLIKLVALLLRANQYAEQQNESSAELIAAWLEQPLKVEQLSLPTIQYLVEFQDTWHSGVENWITSMGNQGRIKGVMGTAVKNGNIENVLYDMKFFNEAKVELER